MLEHRFKKKYGQNFINDKNLLNKIVAVADLKDTDHVLEIGPGSGNLTEAIYQKTKNIIAYEIDNDLIDYLDEKFEKKIQIINQDFLRSDLEHLKEYQNIKVIANLPYYITTPIIMRLIESDLEIDKMVLMVQKEVAERFVATPNNRSYNALTVILNYFYDIKIAFNVNKKIFFPVPKVDSAVVVFERKISNQVCNIETFKKLVKAAFLQKRKMLRNNLAAHEFELLLADLKKLGYDEKVRAENLKLEDFIELANILEKAKS